MTPERSRVAGGGVWSRVVACQAACDTEADRVEPALSIATGRADDDRISAGQAPIVDEPGPWVEVNVRLHSRR